MIDGTQWEKTLNPIPVSAVERMRLKTLRKQSDDYFDSLDRTSRAIKTGVHESDDLELMKLRIEVGELEKRLKSSARDYNGFVDDEGAAIFEKLKELNRKIYIIESAK